MASLLMQGGCAIPAQYPCRCRWCCGDVAAPGRGEGRNRHAHSAAALPPCLAVPAGPPAWGRGRVEKGVSHRGQAVLRGENSPSGKEKPSEQGPAPLIPRSLREKVWEEAGSFLPSSGSSFSISARKPLPPLFTHSE